jgi:D-3-phosphoglycerate dehydrogenase
MVILVSDAFDPGLPDRLAAYGEVTDDKRRLPEAEIVLIRSKTKVTREYIDGAPRLGLVIRGGVGLDNVDRGYAEERGIEIRNTAAASSVAVAELAFALMLSLPNHLVRADRSMREGRWLKRELERSELHGKTLGILGLGRIGAEVAKRAAAFGMSVIAYDPYVDSSEHAELKPTLKEVLNASDYVSAHMPLTDETRGMINRETLTEFKDGACLINTGRGAIIVDEDVAEALRGGKLAGFGNDVWQSDPPGETPLIDAPNTVMTPHIGASTRENLLRIGDLITEIVAEYVGRR